jgi:hypothetical protein
MSQNKPGPRELALRAMRESRVSQSSQSKTPSTQREAVMPKKAIAKTKNKKVKGADENGSKKAIVASLLQRKNGCTGKEVKEATGWPTVSMAAMAKSCGLRLRKEKTDKGMRYYGSL